VVVLYRRAGAVDRCRAVVRGPVTVTLVVVQRQPVPGVVVPSLPSAAASVGQLVGKPLWCDVVGQKVERCR